ncbi:MAG TPA: DUF2252 domain-containing protein [Jatrophihabitans sp.]|jgi:uncharacterized protein (DUF2252 family)
MTATVTSKRTAAKKPAAGTARLPAAHETDYPTPKERAAVGKQLRKELPLAAHADVARDPSRPGPVELLEEQCTTRVPELIPVRYGRMAVSPFTFYRGAARVMASDLAAVPHSTLNVQLCGDAHLSNFGFFGSPERRLVFDINDFDETLPGPFEWDVKRLAASMVVAARAINATKKEARSIARASAERYRTTMAEFATMRDIDVWYASADAEQLQNRIDPLLDAKRRKRLSREFDKYRTRDSMQALTKLTSSVDGTVQIVGDPPLIVPVRDLVPAAELDDPRRRFSALIRQYRRTLLPERRILLEQYHFVDMARKVVGVGSVGTRCWIVLLTGRDRDDPLFLQIKEANASVLAEFIGKSEHNNQGQRVVTGQRIMQQASDIFLGWQRTTGIDDVERDFYLRQLRDWKGSIEIESLLPKGLNLYGQICAWSLARAHARSGDRIAIAGYLGSSDAFDRAIGDFAEHYADVNERDFAALTDAIESGMVAAQSGL